MNKDKRNNIKLLGTLNNADESGIIANANQIYDANENKSTQDVSKEHTERIKTLETKENSMQTTLENITKTGEASAASNVTYDHNDSKLNATNVQQAIDEVSSIGHFAKRGGVINISTNYNSEHTAEVLTLTQALSKVPSTDRVLGFQGKYLATDGWHTIIYTGDSLSTWTNSTKWIDLADKVFNSISNNATFAGIATPTTNPGTPDGLVFYLATKAGTYANFGGIKIAPGKAVILQWNNGSWAKKATGLAIEQQIGIKSIVFPQYRIINIDLKNKKVIISTGEFYYSSFNKNNNNFAVTIPQEIDISDKLKQNSALLFDTNNKTFVFYNYTEQNAITDDMAIIALLNETNIYYVSCDILVNGERFGPINAQKQVKDILSKIDISSLKLFQDNVNYNTLPIIGFSDLSITLNTTTKEYTYGSFNVFYGKGKYHYNVPPGSGIYVNGRQMVLSGLNTIFFNISTKEIAWVTFERYSDYIGKYNKDWIVLEHFLNSTPIIGFIHAKKSNGTWLSVSDALGERITYVSDVLDDVSGILWSNLFVGSDMEKGYNQDNILAFSTYPSLGGTVERVLDNETSRYCIKAHFPTGTEFTNSNNYVYPSLMKSIRFTGEDTTQEFSVSFRYKCSPNFIGFCPLCNSTWMEYLNSNGSWAALYLNSISLVKDNDWHYAHIVTRKTDVSNKTYSVALYAYLAAGSAVTLEEDLDFCITDIVISPSRFPDYSVVRNVNDYLGSVDKETLQPTVNKIISEYPDAHGCVFMSLGDSITTEGYYIAKLRQLLAPSKYYNLAVASATWADRSGTTSYDGNPSFLGDQTQNVLGNQVQKIINNPDTYNAEPDIIIIAAGTNDGQPVPISTSQQEIIADINTHFYAKSAAIPITNPTFDDSDTYMSHRKTIAGAMRYVVCKLQEMYPKARIYILTPIQGCYSSRNYGTSIAAKQLYISEVAKHLGIPVIHVGEECGIQADFEYQGAMWTGPSSSNEKSGRDLFDGLHPNTSGGWKMAKYIYNKLKNDYVNQNY